MNKRQFGAAAAVVLALWGAIEFFQLEKIWNATFSDPYVIAAQHQRFAGVAGVVPADAIAGYLTDMEPDTITWSAAFNGAQYVLAPRLLEPGSNREWLITNFAKRGDFEAYAKANGFRIVRDFGQGVVVMRKEPR